MAKPFGGRSTSISVTPRRIGLRSSRRGPRMERRMCCTSFSMMWGSRRWAATAGRSRLRTSTGLSRRACATRSFTRRLCARRRALACWPVVQPLDGLHERRLGEREGEVMHAAGVSRGPGWKYCSCT